MAYLAPEQIRGERANEATDIWAVGVAAYELISYRKPFNGHSAAQLLQNIVSQEPTPLRELVPDCPNDLAELIATMLCKDIEKRFHTMDDLLPGLERAYRDLAALSVRELLNLTEEYLKSNRTKALEVLREVLQIDGSNEEAKRRQEAVLSAVKEESVTTRLRSLIEKANSNLEQGNLSDAREAVLAAIQIDPGYEPAQQLLEQLDHLEHRAETIDRLLKEGFDQLAQRKFSSVEELARKVLDLQADNSEALALLRKAQAATRFPAAAQASTPGAATLNALPPPPGFLADQLSRVLDFSQARRFDTKNSKRH